MIEIIPKTIEELKEWYNKNNLPSEEITRFFIGKDYKYPKAFGIFKDETTGNFVVYKNKDTGERAIRYEGKDEEYAVRELYLRLTQEILNQKKHNNYNKNSQNLREVIIVAIITITIILIGFFLSISSLNRGYYKYNSDYYYYQSGSWYLYDDYYGWERTSAPKELKKNKKDYYQSSKYDSYGIDRFENSKYYKEYSSDSSDYSWSSSDSWDSGSTDWSSDW